MSAKKMFSTMLVERVGAEGRVAHVMLNRPDKGNAMNAAFWKEYRKCFQDLAADTTCKCIVVSANGKHFSVGLDIKEMAIVPPSADDEAEDGKPREKDVARNAWANRKHLLEYQDTMTCMEKCPQPVIVASHGATIGGAIDLMLAADIRVCSEQAWFSIKEVDIGLAADVGTLQRLHHAIGNSSLARELCYTARRFDAEEAKSCGFVSKVLKDRDELIKYSLDLANEISMKSPVAIASTKINLLYSREHTVQESLDYMAIWNASMLQTEDIKKAALASLTKSKQPDFSKL